MFKQKENQAIQGTQVENRGSLFSKKSDEEYELLNSKEDVNFDLVLTVPGSDFPIAKSLMSQVCIVSLKNNGGQKEVALIVSKDQSKNVKTLIQNLDSSINKSSWRLVKKYKAVVSVINDIYESADQDSIAEDINEVERKITEILKRAVQEKASDVHFTINDAANYTTVRVRANGLLKDIASFDSKMGYRIHMVAFQKSRGEGSGNSQLNKKEDSNFSIKWKQANIDNCRISYSPSILGACPTWRLYQFDEDSKVQSFESLGYSPEAVKIIKSFTHHTTGFVLFSGEIGSGKTTLLHTLLSNFIKENTSPDGSITKKVITIEDPVELIIPGADQRQVYNSSSSDKDLIDGELQYIHRVNSILRSNPDVVMLGEIRYESAAKAMMDLAEIGNLALGTIHGLMFISAIKRMIEKFDFNLDTFSIGSSLKGLVAQKLVPKVCPDCSISVDQIKDQDTKTLIHEVLSEFKLENQGKRIDINDLKVGNPGQDCKTCGGQGFFGRTLIYEIYNPTDNLSSVAKHIKNKDYFRAYQAFMESDSSNGVDGITIGESCLDKVLSGDICASMGVKILKSLPVRKQRKNPVLVN